MEMSVGAGLSFFSRFTLLQRVCKCFVFMNLDWDLDWKRNEGEEGIECHQPGFKSFFLHFENKSSYGGMIPGHVFNLSVRFLRICHFICEHLVFKLCDKQH